MVCSLLSEWCVATSFYQRAANLVFLFAQLIVPYHKKAIEFHIDYVTNLSGKYERPMLEVGMRYIQFAVEEKNLFRFLYHSNYYTGVSLSDWLTGKIFDSLIPILRRQARVDERQAYSIFSQIVLVTHGIASLLANNAMVYDEAYCINTLSDAYFGIMYLNKRKRLIMKK